MTSHKDHIDHIDKDPLLLEELIEHLEFAYKNVMRFERAEDLVLSRRDRNSAVKEIEQVQECAKKLGAAATAAIPEIPWNELRGLRNVIVHEHGDIDWDVLYNTVTVEFPGMIKILKEVVAKKPPRKSLGEIGFDALSWFW
jgi:uncharacterized protein with HEPN domain